MTVALLAEGVDRNIAPKDIPADEIQVALLAEGVDRNLHLLHNYTVRRVALLAEGVDRNLICCLHIAQFFRSPSSRRAWIEIW